MNLNTMDEVFSPIDIPVINLTNDTLMENEKNVELVNLTNLESKSTYYDKQIYSPKFLSNKSPTKHNMEIMPGDVIQSPCKIPKMNINNGHPQEFNDNFYNFNNFNDYNNFNGVKNTSCMRNRPNCTLTNSELNKPCHFGSEDCGLTCQCSDYSWQHFYQNSGTNLSSYRNEFHDVGWPESSLNTLNTNFTNMENNHHSKVKPSFEFPTSQPSKKPNCTVTSETGDSSVIELNNKVPAFFSDSDACNIIKNASHREENVIRDGSLLNLEDQVTVLSQNSESLQEQQNLIPLPSESYNYLGSNNERTRGAVFHEDSAVIPVTLNNPTHSTELPEFCSQLLEIFPGIDVAFIKRYTELNFDLEQIIEVIINMNNDYPKQQITPTPMNVNGATSTDSTSVFSSNGSSNKPVQNISCIKPASEDLTLSKPVETLTSEDNVVENIQSTNKIATKKPSNFEFLQEILPDADPEFLKEKCKLKKDDMNKFINVAVEKNDYPKIIKVTPKEENKESDDIELYSKDFDIVKFLKIFPEPFSFFNNPQRICYQNGHAIAFLKNRYRSKYVTTITQAYKSNYHNLTLTCKALDNELSGTRSSKRCKSDINMPTSINLPFLQEACFIEHMAEIESYIKNEDEKKKSAFNLAREKGELIECGCCYGEVLFEDCATCDEGDLFCKPCIQRGAEVRIGDGLTTFPCLADCGSSFSLTTLKGLLESRVFSKLLQRIQMEEVRSADIEGLEMCPFCEFATIPLPDNRIFTCMNPDCLKESCRQCHKVNHIPMRCEEVENDDQVKARKYIEDEMTRALVRECYRCKKSFIKTDGCNKMTCTCGAKMCYICRQPIQDYKHFNGPGNVDDTKCPLYSSEDLLHVEAVEEIAQKAKEKVSSENPSLKLKHDPTKLLPTKHNKADLPAGVIENRQHLLQTIRAAAAFHDLLTQNIGLQHQIGHLGPHVVTTNSPVVRLPPGSGQIPPQNLASPPKKREP